MAVRFGDSFVDLIIMAKLRDFKWKNLYQYFL
jgi:hypothetical protein